MRDGTVEPLGSSGSAESTIETIAAAFSSSSADGVEQAAVFHAGVPELASALAGELGGVDFISGFSVAMQIHTGRGVVGAAWLPSRSR